MIEPREASRVTIIDVANAAGVSRQTVSNVINNPERVAVATRERVLDHIAALGFRPSRAARLLRNERAGAWGFELDTTGERRMGNVLDRFLIELTDRAAVRHAQVMPFVAEPARSVAAYRELILGRSVDGFVIANTGYDDPRPAWLQASGIPFAAFGRIWDDPAIEAYADVDGAAGIRAAVRHLREAGYERIGFLGWPAGSPVGEDRRAGWLDTAGPGPEARAEQDIASAAAAAGDLIAQVGLGGAIVCASDLLAVGVWRRLADDGLSAGRDIGLVGFDDSDLASAINLTSLAQPLPEVADHVLALLAGTADGARLLTPELIVRSSSGGPSVTDPSAPDVSASSQLDPTHGGSK